MEAGKRMRHQTLAQPAHSEIDERLPRYQALRDDLATRIAEGGWDFSKPLPSELKLAKEYDVALGTMRRAVEALVREGILERRHGSGTYIRRSDFSGSMSRFLRFRSLHGTIAFQKSRVLSASIEPAPAHVCDPLGLKRGADAIVLDRRRYSDDELLLAEQIWLRHDRFAPLLEIDPDEYGPLLYRLYETRCGQIVARAVEGLKISTADATVGEMLGIAEGDAIVIIERTAFDFADKPLEWRRSFAEAKHFEYRIEIR